MAIHPRPRIRVLGFQIRCDVTYAISFCHAMVISAMATVFMLSRHSRFAILFFSFLLLFLFVENETTKQRKIKNNINTIIAITAIGIWVKRKRLGLWWRAKGTGRTVKSCRYVGVLEPANWFESSSHNKTNAFGSVKLDFCCGRVRVCSRSVWVGRSGNASQVSHCIAFALTVSTLCVFYVYFLIVLER